VRKKYKDQKEQYAAMQAIYKEYGVNPVAGCLPLLIQLPILYGLFFALREALNVNHLPPVQYLISLNQSIYPFLPKFLIPPDPNMIWFGGPINLGFPDPTHILPILAALATFLQLRMSQPRTRTGSKDTMTQQMAIMQYIMPLITLFFAWTFPAGLALYWTTTSVFSMVQQYFVTGWGSLTVMPEFLQNIFPQRESKNSGGSKTSSGDKRKDTQSVQKTVESTAEVVGSNGHAESSTKSNSSASGSSSARRRSRNNSASARRRGNTPKRNVSRS
jgi:YidC/Oxa1 family membrane protein insertase